MRKGFTYVELIIYLGVFAVISLIFASVLVTFTRLQSRHLSESELNNQINFALQTVQRLVASSKTAAVFVNDGGTPQDQDRGASNTHLIIRRSDPVKDPTKIYVKSDFDFGSGIILPALVTKEGGGSEKALTTNKARVAELTFSKKSNYPSHDIIQITLRLDYNSAPNPATRLVQSAIGRASAATFDDSLYPGSNNTYNIGGAAQLWRDAFYGGVVETKGGLKLNTTTTTKPACGSANRGIIYIETVSNVDQVLVCIQTGVSTYDWRKFTVTVP